MAWGIFLGAGAVTACGQTPPPPNLKQPVNYIQWINEQYSKGLKENAAADYEAAFKAFVDDEAGQALLKERSMAWNSWTDADRRLLREWVKKNEKCLAAFVAASRAKDCFFVLQSDSGLLFAVPMPFVSSFRNMARLLAVRAKLRLADGDTNGALEDLCAMLRCGAHLRNQPAMISYLVGNAISALTQDVLQEIPRIAAKPPDYEAILKLLRKDDLFTLVRPHKQLQLEKLLLWDCLQRWWRDANGDGKPDPIRLPEELIGKDQPPLEMPATLEAGLQQVEELSKKWNAQFGSDYQEAMRATQALETELAAHKSEFIFALNSSLWRASQLQRSMAADRAATRIILNMHAFHAKNGRWPKDLKEAAGGDFTDFRKDPFSGKDFGYRLENGQPFLYSIGRDGKDDGGQRPPSGKKWDETGDVVFWPPAEK